MTPQPELVPRNSPGVSDAPRYVPREIGRRLVAVEVILRVTPRRRADHLRDTIVRYAHLLHPAHGDEHVDEGGRVGALDLLLCEKVADPGSAAPLEVVEPAGPQRLPPLDHDLREVDGEQLQLEALSQHLPRL